MIGGNIIDPSCRRVRREVVDSMRFLMKLAKEKNPEVSDIFVYWKCIFPMNSHICWLVGGSGDRLVSQHFFKRQ